MTHPTQREILESIAAKQARRPRVDNQGKPLDGKPRVRWQYDAHGRLVGQVKAEEEADA